MTTFLHKKSHEKDQESLAKHTLPVLRLTFAVLGNNAQNPVEIFPEKKMKKV